MFEQERMIGRIQRRAAGDPAIMACFLSGSFGRRTADDYSDLDVALVFQDSSKRHVAWDERTSIGQSFMPYVAMKSFDADHIRPYFHILLFANGCKVDLRYETIETLEPNPWDNQIRILKDLTGWAETYQANSLRIPFSQSSMNLNELVALDQRFWVMYWDIFRQLLRGDTEKSFETYLQLLNFHIPPLLNCLPQNEPARAGLIHASFSLQPRSTITGLADLLDNYLAARKVIIRDYHLAFLPDAAFESEIQKLVAKFK